MRVSDEHLEKHIELSQPLRGGPIEITLLLAEDLRDARAGVDELLNQRDALEESIQGARDAIAIETMRPDDGITLDDAFNRLQAADRILQAAHSSSMARFTPDP